jgi:hypothetical protein
MAQNEPNVPLEPVDPSSRPSSKVPALPIDKNSHGNWVMRDPLRLMGGLFVSPIAALRFAQRAYGCSRAVLMASYPLGFDASRLIKAANNDSSVHATYQPQSLELSEPFGSRA